MLTEHRRVKHGHLPGEINRGYLIAMLENRRGEYEIEVFPWQHLTERDARSFRRSIREKGRTVQRQRDRQVTLAALGEL